MSNIFNKDFKEFLEALNLFAVEYMVVGGYAVILHGYTRTTGDLDVWINPTKANYQKLMQAFDHFGLPTVITLGKFLDSEKYDVFTFGVPPVSLDIMTKVKGLSFEDCYLLAEDYSSSGIKIKLISQQDLIIAKQASGRHKDLNDIEHLKSE